MDKRGFDGYRSFVLYAQQKELAMDEMWSDVAANNQVFTQEAAWFREAKYAMFIHWGLFCQNANRWQGKTYYGIGEWIMRREANRTS